MKNQKSWNLRPSIVSKKMEHQINEQFHVELESLNANFKIVFRGFPIAKRMLRVWKGELVDQNKF